jgi:hypothetical protein
MRYRCDTCRYWHRGYRLQGMKVPDFCTRHAHSQPGDDPACREYSTSDMRENAIEDTEARREKA